MKRVRITVKKMVSHTDLMQEYELPLEHACELKLGQVFISEGGKKPKGMCDAAWESMRFFVIELANGGGYFYGDWMRNPKSAMVACNDGFRPVSFLVEALED